MWFLGAVKEFVELSVFADYGMYTSDTPFLFMLIEVLLWPLWSVVRSSIFCYELFKERVDDYIRKDRKERLRRSGKGK